MNEKAKELINLLYTDKLTQFGKRQLADMIEKQQKEIDELQSYIKEYLIPKSTINLLYVSKDKIRAKIKELDEKWHVLYRDSEVKDILKELLEEE